MTDSKDNQTEPTQDPNEQDLNTQGADAANEADLENVDASFEEISDAGPAVDPNAPPTIESLQAQLAEAEKRVLLAQADLENFRRRNLRDTQDKLKYASIGLMTEILDSVDNLHRAIESYKVDPNGDGLVKGVEMVAQQISTALENKGCKKIEAVGQTFDPHFHQALQMQPSDEFDSNVVSTELRAGFKLHDRVVRASQVFVSTGPAATE
ncbi:MAG: nucleotide exchange factor GrpE [Mariniblastus sp.]